VPLAAVKAMNVPMQPIFPQNCCPNRPEKFWIRITLIGWKKILIYLLNKKPKSFRSFHFQALLGSNG
jgi:hypothetical protein